MKHIFIVNPVSGKADASGTLVPKIIKAAKEKGIDYEILLTEHPRHAVEIVQLHAAEGEPVRFYACGGDGTLNEVIEGAYPFSNAEVASVPCGSGNDFIRNFGKRGDFMKLDALIDGESMVLDLIKTPCGIAAAICAAGFDAKVAYGIPQWRRIPFCGGSMAYYLSIVQTVLGKMGHQLRVVADEEVIEGNFLLMAVGNGTTYGGGFQATPEADLTDGMMDLLLVKKISRIRFAQLLGRYKSGKHIVNGEVSPDLADVLLFRRIKKVDIQTLDGRPIIMTKDGECAPCHEMHLSMLPEAFRFVLPKGMHYAPKLAQN